MIFSANRHFARSHVWSMIPRVKPEGRLFRKPVSSPDQVRARLFRDHAPGAKPRDLARETCGATVGSRPNPKSGLTWIIRPGGGSGGVGAWPEIGNAPDGSGNLQARHGPAIYSKLF